MGGQGLATILAKGKHKIKVYNFWNLTIESYSHGWKFGQSDVFTTIEEEEHENSYHLNVIDESSNNESEAVIELLNIIETFQVIVLAIPSMSNCPSSPMFCYYVEMPHSLVTPTNNHEEDQLVVNLEDVIPNLNNLINPSQTRGPIGLSNLLLLLILPTKIKTRQWTISGLFQFMWWYQTNIWQLWNKRQWTKNLLINSRSKKWKKRRRKKSKKAKGTQFAQTKQTTQRRSIKKEDITKFNYAWFVAIVNVVGERFHNNFKARFQAHPLGYKRFGVTIMFT